MKRLQKLVHELRGLLLKLPRRTLLILICILIGIVAGLSAFLLKNLLIFVHSIINYIGHRAVSTLVLAVLLLIGLIV
jgi:hypothetical protein